MKKKGAALVTVLVIFTALIVIATAISSAVINTNKLNKRYSDTIDLELAAKSGVNIVKEDFISKVKSKEIKTLDNVKSYIEKVNNYSFNEKDNINILFNEYLKNNIDLSVNLNLEIKDDRNMLKITSIAENKGILSVEKIEEQSLLLDIKGEQVSGGDLSGVINQNVTLIIGSESGIVSLRNVNGGIIVVDEKKKYDSYNNSQGLFNSSGTIESDINIDIQKLKISNPVKESNVFYLADDMSISYNLDSKKQTYFKMTVDGQNAEYEIKNNYNGFIIVTVNGNLTIEGYGHVQNMQPNIIYVVNGDVSIINNSEQSTMMLNNMAIMANKVKNVLPRITGFNRVLIITNELDLYDATLDRWDKNIEAISIINQIIKGQSID